MEYTREVKNRLRRIEGQIRGILQMMEDDQPCEEVSTQLTAVRAALEKATMLIVGTNLEECIRREIERGNSARNEIDAAIRLMMRVK